MKAWIASCLLSALKLLGESAVAWYCTAERGEAQRERDRLIWWKFREKATVSAGKSDDLIAEYLRARFNFHDSPDTKASKQLAEKAGLVFSEPKPVYPVH